MSNPKHLPTSSVKKRKDLSLASSSIEQRRGSTSQQPPPPPDFFSSSSSSSDHENNDNDDEEEDKQEEDKSEDAEGYFDFLSYINANNASPPTTTTAAAAAAATSSSKATAPSLPVMPSLSPKSKLRTSSLGVISNPGSNFRHRSSFSHYASSERRDSFSGLSTPQSNNRLGENRRESIPSRFYTQSLSDRNLFQDSLQDGEPNTDSDNEDSLLHDQFIPSIVSTDQIHVKSGSTALLQVSGSRRKKQVALNSAKARTNIMSSIRERRLIQERLESPPSPSMQRFHLVEAAAASAVSSPDSPVLKRRGESKDNFFRLERGGVILETSLGFIQFGIPPETIKDVLNLGLEVPQYYVVPKDRFDTAVGLNMCEVEFPGYYQFFIKQRSMTLIVPDADTEKGLRQLMDELLQGPPAVHLYTAEECVANPEASPDHVKELAYFVRPRNGRSIDVNSLYSFVRFSTEDDSPPQVTLGKVQIIESDREWIVLDDGQELARIEFWLASVVPPKFPFRASVPERNFVPPMLGVTVLGSSHGFDPKQSTSGFVLWMHGKGIMVDPPPEGDILRRAGISPRWISAIILTHCHADHDAGTFQKILVEGRVTLMTTKTIMASFLRKYSRISGFTEAFLCRLFEPRVIRIGEDVFYAGGRLRFHYALHALPCIGFQAFVKGKSVAYSADTLYDPQSLHALCEEGVLSKGRMQSLLDFPFETADLVIHEAGIPPIHTPVEVLKALSENARKRLYLIHITEQAAEASGLRLAKAGSENTLRVLDNIPGNNLSGVLDVLTQSELFFPYLTQMNQVGRGIVFAAQERMALVEYENPQALDFAYLDVVRFNSDNRFATGVNPFRPSTFAVKQERRSSGLSNTSRSNEGVERASKPVLAQTRRLSQFGRSIFATGNLPNNNANPTTTMLDDDDFTVPQVADLLRMANFTTKSIGEIVSAHQGEGDVGLYLILKGFCRIDRDLTKPLVGVESSQVQPCEGPIGTVLEPGGFGMLSVTDNQHNPLVRSSQVSAITPVELLELDLCSLWYMLNTYPVLDHRLSRMHQVRMLSAWKTIELNSCLQRLVSFQRTQLLSILEPTEFKAGEELWSKRPGPRNAFLVIQGELCFSEMGENDSPFVSGAFLCDFHSMVERKRGVANSNLGVMTSSPENFSPSALPTPEMEGGNGDVNSECSVLSGEGSGVSALTLVAKTNCKVFQIDWKDAFQFLESNPGVLVQIYHSCAME